MDAGKAFFLKQHFCTTQEPVAAMRQISRPSWTTCSFWSSWLRQKVNSGATPKAMKDANDEDVVCCVQSSARARLCWWSFGDGTWPWSCAISTALRRLGGKFLDVYAAALCISCITSCVSKSRFSFFLGQYLHICKQPVWNTVITPMP